jgi:hypothetical protein
MMRFMERTVRNSFRGNLQAGTVLFVEVVELLVKFRIPLLIAEGPILGKVWSDA